MPSKKRRRFERPTIHPRNRYSENVPDFRVLASLYPSFEPFVYYTRGGWPKIDWTDYNATRELTRVLLDHDHNVKWWIPDGQLCPAVPNRSNYVHWIEDLLSSDIIPKFDSCGDKVRGFDIGTGANCIYPLLGASLLGWSFVGSDVTNIAIEWARKNVDNNPHLLNLIEIRKVGDGSELRNNGDDTLRNLEEIFDQNTDQTRVDEKTYTGPPVLLGVVRDGENFDFCMCNPPFFETIEEAGLNPETSFGGTHKEMVFPGGERAFITKIIEDSVELKQTFRWYTSMVGRKVNLKFLVSKLHDVGVSIVKTTEFVQGQTSRWGLAWSFAMPNVKIMASHVPEKNHLSFTLEGLPRQFGAVEVLKSVELNFLAAGASCKTNLFAFTVDITASNENCGVFLKDDAEVSGAREYETLHEPWSKRLPPSDELCFRVSVFEQIPGILLVKGSLLRKQSPLSGLFVSVFQKLEQGLRRKFSGKSGAGSNT